MREDAQGADEHEQQQARLAQHPNRWAGGENVMLCAPGPLQKQEAGQCGSQQKGICQEGGLPPKPAGDETGTYPAQEGPEHGGRGIDDHGPLQGLLPAVQGDVRHQGQQDGRDQQPGQGAQGQQLPEGRRKQGCQQDKSARAVVSCKRRRVLHRLRI